MRPSSISDDYLIEWWLWFELSDGGHLPHFGGEVLHYGLHHRVYLVSVDMLAEASNAEAEWI